MHRCFQDLPGCLKEKENVDFYASGLRRNITFWNRVKLLCGGPRRYFLRLLKPEYVQKQLTERQGDCTRCGNCCQMSWRCQHLYYDSDGLACCKLYEKVRRSSWCADFPIDERCLADRKLAGFKGNCGFYWQEPKKL